MLPAVATPLSTAPCGYPICCLLLACFTALLLPVVATRTSPLFTPCIHTCSNAFTVRAAPRGQVALCALRTEMRELLEGLRQETSSRVRILKERLDRTDRELLRQLEDSQNNDRSDKFDALAAVSGEWRASQAFLPWRRLCFCCTCAVCSRLPTSTHVYSSALHPARLAGRRD